MSQPERCALGPGGQQCDHPGPRDVENLEDALRVLSRRICAVSATMSRLCALTLLLQDSPEKRRMALRTISNGPSGHIDRAWADRLREFIEVIP